MCCSIQMRRHAVADRELLTLSEWQEEETDQAHETDDLLSKQIPVQSTCTATLAIRQVRLLLKMLKFSDT
jgi:hypothetical protein